MARATLVASASIGWGHTKAAQNISQALGYCGGDGLVQEIDVIDYMPSPIGSLWRKGWTFASRRLGNVYGCSFDLFTRAPAASVFARWLARRVARRILHNFNNLEIASFVATHSFAAAVGSELKRLAPCMLSVVATDFVVHAMQVYDNVDAFFVPPGCEFRIGPSDLAYVMARSQVTGIPIALEFAKRGRRREVIQNLGFSEALPTVLMSFGGSGLLAERHVKLPRLLLQERTPLQFIVLTGHNRRFAERMHAEYEDSNFVRIVEYADKVSDYYQAADLFVGKAGGLSVSEAIASGLPLGVLEVLPGQEEPNAGMVESRGLGKRIASMKDLAEWIRITVGHLCAARDRLGTFARPSSSLDLASALASLRP